MKYFIYFLLTLSSFSIYSQEKLSALKIDNYEGVFTDTLSSNIYEINKNDFHGLIKNSKKKYHLIYVFAWWCKPCIETFPAVLDHFYKNKNIELYILNIERNNSKDLKHLQDILKKQYHIKKATFMISEVYGKRPKKKYTNFIYDLVPEHEKYGLGLFLLFDKKLNNLYASTYLESKDEKINKIIELTIDNIP